MSKGVIALIAILALFIGSYLIRLSDTWGSGDGSPTGSAATPTPKTSASLGGTAYNKRVRVTLRSYTLTEKDVFMDPGETKQYIAYKATVTNIGSTPLSVSDWDFSLHTKNGQIITSGAFGVDSDIQIAHMDLAPNGSVSILSPKVKTENENL